MSATETQTDTESAVGQQPPWFRRRILQRASFGKAVRSAEIDSRLLGMLGALAVIWIVFHILSGGTFLTARNLWNLSVQTAVVAIMATGMVLVIVSRNIDLSVGSMLGMLGMAMAVVQTEVLPDWLGLGHWAIFPLALIFGLVLGGLVGGLQGVIVAYVRVPSFIVTLGGYLVWRGAAWALSRGRTIAPMDRTFQTLGGGSRGAIGETWSWIIAGVLCLGMVFLLWNTRRQRIKFDFRLRPMWAEVSIGTIGCAAILGAVFVLNHYYLPVNLAKRYAAEHGIVYPPGGLQIPLGLAVPVLIVLGVALVMTFVATRRKFGRYVFAIGGNPEAAELGGINTRRTLVKTFVLMGVLVAIAAAVSIGRLNAATSGLGTLSVLYVSAAAVSGGTSLLGGVGTISGAVLGALVTQSLQSGMVLMGIESAYQQIVIGIVLVMAVAIDSIFRKRVTT
jgi:D-xylose transport system permease protein